MIMASAVAFYIPVTTFTCPRKDRRFTIQWVFGETPWIEKRTTLIRKGVQRQLHLQKNRRVKTKWTSSRASSFGFSLMVTIKWSTDWDKKVSKYKQTHFSTAQTHVSVSFSQCNWKFLGPKRPPGSVIQTSICYLNTWVALLLSLQQQNPNTIFSALTSKGLELITLAKDKIPPYCSFSFRKLIQALALKSH